MIKIDRSNLKRKLEPIRNPFLSLARSIIYQQISTKAGDSIHGRFLKLFGRKSPSPTALLSFTDAELRTAGLSGQKAKYLRDLARKFLDGTVNPKLFGKMTDEEIKEHLVRVKGIGPWTADLFLIFALNRPNVLPVGDLGIMKGFQKVFKLRSLPSEKRMRQLAKPHKGEHTYLALYLWQALDE
ncbi:DNA-3-methyladenine glycosylase 2 family protein [Candidatus Parcubacteria bacterium]|nr:DNA-3-methyladenine glycosylase 2 family protein [Candidatus Parcubacteria bacterium]